MFDNILIATDNSPLMKNAIQYTATLFPKANYHLINVINTTDSSIPQTNLMQNKMAKMSQEALANGEEILNEMGIEDVHKNSPAGKPSSKIIECIEDNDIDLLVMATHSKTGAQRVHIGETATHSLEITSIPSMIFSCRCELETPKKIFNPSTFSSYSIDASMLAIEIADYFDASLTTYDIGDKEADPSAKKIEQRAEKMGVEYKLETNKGATDKEIIKKAGDFDFIVGSRGRSGWRYKLRHIFRGLALSNLEKELIAEVEMPFLMVGD